MTAYCPRCGTALSDHEVALGYKTVEDPSVFLRFPVVEAADPSLVGVSLLVWTTTPWTLPSNTGVAVDPGATYVLVEVAGERLLIAEPLVGIVWRGGTSVRTLTGSELVGARYEPPYANVEGAHRVVAGDFVSMEDGTGIVHLAPAFGPDDLALGRAQGWPVFKPVDDAGRFNDDWLRRSCAGCSSRTPTRASCRTCGSAASCSARRPTSTTTRSVGGVPRRSCTTRARPGTCGRPP